MNMEQTSLLTKRQTALFLAAFIAYALFLDHYRHSRLWIALGTLAANGLCAAWCYRVFIAVNRTSAQ